MLVDQIKKACEANGIKSVAIIDDAFDSPSLSQISKDEFLNAQEQLEEKKEVGVQRELSKIIGSDFSEIEFDELKDEHVENLWNYKKDRFGRKTKTLKYIDIIFDKFIRAADKKKEEVLPLQAVMEEIGLQVETFGTEVENAPEKVADFPILAVDCFLDFDADPSPIDLDDFQGNIEDLPNQDAAAIRRSLDFIRKVSGRASVDKEPSLILISSKADASIADTYREESEQLNCRFRFVHKTSVVEKRAEVLLDLFDLLSSYNDARDLEGFLACWKQAAESAIAKTQMEIRNLDLADFGFLKNFRLEAEGESVGEYLSWMFSSYLEGLTNSQVHEGDGRKFLGSLNLESFPSLPQGPSVILADIYSHIRVQSHRGYRGADNGDVRPGDLFVQFEHDENEEVIKRRVYAVISGACDVMRGEGRAPVDEVLLVEGRLQPVKSVLPSHRDFVRYNSDLWAVEWQAKNITTWPYADFTKRKLNRNLIHWFGQLRTHYFLELQGKVLSEIGRVGVPVPPIMPIPTACCVYVKQSNGDGKLITEFSEDSGAVSEFGGRSTGETKDKRRYVFSGSFAREVIKAAALTLSSDAIKQSDRQKIESSLSELLDFRQLHEPISKDEIGKKFNNIEVAINNEKTNENNIKPNKPILIQIIRD
jgi:hypothetical protein